jgi:hypothetical protein
MKITSLIFSLLLSGSFAQADVHFIKMEPICMNKVTALSKTLAKNFLTGDEALSAPPLMLRIVELPEDSAVGSVRGNFQIKSQGEVLDLNITAQVMFVGGGKKGECKVLKIEASEKPEQQ